MNEAPHSAPHQNKIWQKSVFLFDCDGTLYIGGREIPGATASLSRLRNAGKEIFFFTNNSSRDRKTAYDKLHKMGLCHSEQEIVMSTDHVISYLRTHRISAIYLIGTRAMEGMLACAGIRHTAIDPEVVVVGFDRELTLAKLDHGVDLIVNGCPYLLAHGDPFCPVESQINPNKDSRVVDCGAIGAMIATATEQQPIAVLGKPHQGMIEEVESRTDRSRSDMIIIGDRLDFDIAMGTHAGVDTIFVLTGHNTKEDLHPNAPIPTYILNSVREL